MIEKIEFPAENWDVLRKKVGESQAPLHLVVVGTKPDLIKQAPILKALLKRGERALLIHTGQHYDENLSGGIEREFGLKVAINLKVGGLGMLQNITATIERFGFVLESIKAAFPHLKVIPYVHGDTTTAFATTVASFHLGFPVVHVEAGIRTLMMKKEVLEKKIPQSKGDFKEWFKVSSEASNYSKGSHEPFPEQWNTRTVEAGSGLFMAPVDLAADNLKAEGFPEDRIFTVGNSVVDAMGFVEDMDSDIFERYPVLENGFVRFCVHRRENTESEERFNPLFDLIEKFVKSSPLPILWIVLPGTRKAIERFGLLERFEVLKLAPNIVISDVWPKYSDVMAAMKRCLLCATDSGSMQEEMNLMGIPCATLRFGSDRPETLFARSNILCPPTDAEVMENILLGALDHKDLFRFPPLYGSDISNKIVDHVLEGIASGKMEMRLRP